MLLVHFGPFCLSLLMLNKQIFQSYWLFFAEQKYDFIPLHNSKLCRKTRVHNLTIIDNTLKLSLPLTAVYFSSGNYFKSENFWGGSSPPLPLPLLRAWSIINLFARMLTSFRHTAPFREAGVGPRTTRNGPILF